jgi:hypothetical protein
MNFLDFAPHLLADAAVVGMALGHRAKLDHVQRFAQIHFHVPADLVGEWHDVLRFARQDGVNVGLKSRQFSDSRHAFNLNFIRLLPQLCEIVRRL